MGLRGPVLAATDLSEAADAALRQGQAIAADIGAAFVVCHVLPESFRVRVLFPQDAGIDRVTQAELDASATGAVRARLASILPDGTDAAVEIDSGSPHAGILAIADRLDAGLLVMGPGATARRVARSALSPVLIARPSPTGGAVLGATDFSDPSLPAVRMAADEARRRGVRLRLVHCLDLAETAYLTSVGVAGIVALPPVPESIYQDLESAARERLAAALDTVHAEGDAQVMRQLPASGILESAATPAAALVVVGTRGRTGLARLALGSVAEDVASHAPCSVLIVPLSPAS
jgi:nucleotide-binding universal stress UspA family protein